eukprot:m.34948 g.34948  ORF g.34948 m.34948 type:complete len:726 (+) comp6571_c0_seq1:96-2273(+)
MREGRMGLSIGVGVLFLFYVVLLQDKQEIVIAFPTSDVNTRISATFYVSVLGSDSNDGSQQSPFQTIGRAQIAARSASKNGAVDVLIGPGIYNLDATLVFTPQDSGLSSSQPITYKGYGGGRPLITSGVQLGNFWEFVESTTNCDIYSQHVSVPYARQLWFADDRMYMARQKILNYETANENSIIYKAGQQAGVPHNLDDVHAVLYESWTASLHQIKSFDLATRNITFTTEYNNQWSGATDGSRYYLENIREGLNDVGYFYFDKLSNVLEICIEKDTSPAGVPIYSPTLSELIRVEGDLGSGVTVSNLNFENLDFAHTTTDLTSCFSSSCDGQSGDFLTTAAIHTIGASNIHFDNITLSHTGSYGLWFDRGTFQSTLTNSRVSDVGAGGVRVGYGISGIQRNASLITDSITITNNIIQDGGHIIQEGCGVLAQAVSHTSITHNLISNFSYTGVSVGWNWGYADTSTSYNNVSYNVIQYIGESLLSDMGCVYTLGKQPGTVVEHNICHDVYSFNYGGWGLYTDEGSSYIQLTNNIVFHTKCAGLHQHYGTDNTFKNNVFGNVNTLQCDAALRSSQHPGTCNAMAPDGACSSFNFFTNIVFQPFQPIFMSTIPTGFQNMTFDNNTYWAQDKTSIQFPMGKTFSQWKAEGKDGHSIISDPEFIDPQANDFSDLNPSSPSIKLGFVPIDISKVGPQDDEMSAIKLHHLPTMEFAQTFKLINHIVWKDEK